MEMTRILHDADQPLLISSSNQKKQLSEHEHAARRFYCEGFGNS
jgi:hypothetical protein